MDPDLQVSPWIVTFARAMAVLRWRYCLPPHPVGVSEATNPIYGWGFTALGTGGSARNTITAPTTARTIIPTKAGT